MSQLERTTLLNMAAELEIRRFRHNSRRFKTGSCYKVRVYFYEEIEIIIQVLERVEHDPVNRCGKIKVKEVCRNGVASNLPDQIIPFQEHFTKSYLDKKGNKEYLLACESINYTFKGTAPILKSVEDVTGNFHFENRLINSCDICLPPPNQNVAPDSRLDGESGERRLALLSTDAGNERYCGARVRFEAGQKYWRPLSNKKKEWFEVVSRTTKRITVKAANGDTAEYQKSVVDNFGSKVEVINDRGGTFLSSSNKGDPDNNNNNGLINEVEFSTMSLHRQLKLVNDLAEQKREAEEELKLLREKIASGVEKLRVEAEEELKLLREKIASGTPSLQIPPRGGVILKRKDPDGASNRTVQMRKKLAFMNNPEENPDESSNEDTRVRGVSFSNRPNAVPFSNIFEYDENGDVQLALVEGTKRKG